MFQAPSSSFDKLGLRRPVADIPLDEARDRRRRPNLNFLGDDRTLVYISSMTSANKTLVLIDDSNVHYGSKTIGWDIDYQKFYDWLSAEFGTIECYFFGGLMTKKAFFDVNSNGSMQKFIDTVKARQGLFKKLKRIGYKVRQKPIASLYDATSGEYKRKCNFDVEIAIIAIDKLSEYDDLVLCSGDGDFEKLVRYIKGKYKKATIICHKDRLNNQLARSASRRIYYRELQSEIERA